MTDGLRGNSSARLWMFDFDNTLAALEPVVDWAASRRELERYLRVNGVGDDIFREIPRGNIVLYENLRGRLSDELARSQIATGGIARSDYSALLRAASSIIESYELRGVERAEPRPGAIELLQSLAEHGRKIAIVTSNSSRTVGQWLTKHQITEMISIVVGRDSGLPLKPAPDSIFRACEAVEIGTDDSVFVGDSEADLRAAIAARVPFYGIASRQETHDRLRSGGAVDVYQSPAALATALNLRRAAHCSTTVSPR
jgi:HAD superfamily hydrolase (TIGR01549 family)